MIIRNSTQDIVTIKYRNNDIDLEPNKVVELPTEFFDSLLIPTTEVKIVNGVINIKALK